MENRIKIKFSYLPPVGGEHKVFLSGSFNQWAAEDLEMKPVADSYQVEIPLPVGKHSYKFIVDGHWIADETADHFEDDGQGGRNSLILVGSSSEKLFLVPLVFKSPKKNAGLTVAGTFNGWNHRLEKMQQIDNKEFKLTLLLPAGRYEYKFILNDEIWLPDPTNPNTCPDDKGGINSVLQVDENFAEFRANESELLSFGLTDRYFPLGEEIGKNLLRFACRTYRNNVDQVSLIYQTKSFEMQKYYTDQNFDHYSIILVNDINFDSFAIKLRKAEKEVLLSSATTLINDHQFPIRRNTSELEWLQQAVVYQIFCDRFCNGDAALNPDFGEWYYDPQKNQLSPAVREKLYHFEPDWHNLQLLKDHPQRHHTFFGGDLPGVRQKIPYLKDLGINCIYFNPLVTGETNHKYDTFDYRQVDPHFGGNEEFKKLVKLCHQNGISVILDFAFNHVGLGFYAFQDCLKKGKKSKFFNWFDWYKWPLPRKITADFKASEYYQCWWDHANLPDLNYDLSRLHPDENYLHDENDAEVNQPLVDYLLEAAAFWLQEIDLDGFRLDVPNEVPFWFWKKFRQKVKSIKPAAWLVGEIWHNAEEWLEHYFDSVMNYSYFREPVLQYFALQNYTSDQFLSELMKGLKNYGFRSMSMMMNLLDSHDTYRYLEAVDGNIARLKPAILFQMCWLGVPHIFYGNEIGMQGGNDPDNRRPMNWNYTDNRELEELHDYVRFLISVRKNHSALIYGDLRIRTGLGEVICFERKLAETTILIIINSISKRKEIRIDFAKSLLEITPQRSTEKIYPKRIGLEPYSGKIFLEKN